MAYAVFGGLTPMLTGAWLQKSAMAPAYYVAGVSVLAILIGFLPLAHKGWTARKTQNIKTVAAQQS